MSAKRVEAIAIPHKILDPANVFYQNHEKKGLVAQDQIRKSSQMVTVHYTGKPLALPVFCTKQCQLHERSLQEVLKDFKDLQQFKQSQELTRLSILLQRLDDLKQNEDALKKDAFFKNIMTALSACASFCAGAIMIASGNTYMGATLILASISSTVSQTLTQRDSPFAPHMQMLSLGLSFLCMAYTGSGDKYVDLLKASSTITMICQSLLGIKSGWDKSKKSTLEKELFLNNEENKNFSIVMKQMLAKTTDIIDKTNQNIEYCVEIAIKQIDLMTQVSKKLNQKRG